MRTETAAAVDTTLPPYATTMKQAGCCCDPVTVLAGLLAVGNICNCVSCKVTVATSQRLALLANYNDRDTLVNRIKLLIKLQCKFNSIHY